MRLVSFCCLLFVLLGISAAQDSNFPVGPQYLLTGSPLFARSIATPSLSLDAPLPSLPEAGPVVEDQSSLDQSSVPNPRDLLPIYYGSPTPSVVEVTSTELPSELPQSIVDAGVTGMTDVQSLRERGYGITLGEIASFWKTHKPHATRVITNADVERLHGS